MRLFKQYIILILLGIMFLAYSSCDKNEEETKSSYFIKYFGNQYPNEGIKVIQDNDEGFLILANTYIENDKDILLLKTDKFGNELWRNRIEEDSVNNSAHDFYRSSDNTFTIVGTSIDYAESDQIFVIKINADGTEMWRRKIGNDTTNEIGYSIAPTNDGGSAITGSTRSGNNTNILYIKIDANGDSICSNSYGDRELNDAGMNIIGYREVYNIITGYYTLEGSNEVENIQSAIYVVSQNGGGENNSIRLTEIIDGSNSGIQSYLDEEENLYMISNVMNSNGKNAINLLKHTNVEGSQYDTAFTRLYQKDEDIHANSFARLNNNAGFAIIGFSTEKTDDILLLVVDNAGDVLIDKSYGGFDNERGKSVLQTLDGGYVILGTIGTEGNSDICLIKTNSEGELK